MNIENSQIRAVCALSEHERRRLSPSSARLVSWRESRADVFDALGMHEWASDVRQSTRHSALALIGGVS